MIPDDTIEGWVRQIGNYELHKDSPRDQQDANFDIDHFLTPEGQVKLYESTHPADRDEPKIARERFLRFLGQKFKDVNWQSDHSDKTVQLADFLQEDGLALYKAAIEEESKSKAFRDAVFFRSLKHFPGNKWLKRMVLWVGGPSSSGKTYGAKGVIEKMSAEILKKTSEEGGNNVVSVDGSYERETSQMRQMVLQFALASGYKGIQDLHKHSKQLAVKYYVRDAALEDKSLSLVIPETFVRNPADIQKEFKTFEKLDVVQAFSEVKAEKDFKNRFQTSVKKMGDSRAWNNKKFTPDKISMNNRGIGCESKVYEGLFFKFGLHGTKIFKKFYKSFSQDKITLTITNDLIYLVKKDGEWKECEYNDILDGQEEGVDFIRMTARAYNYWRDNKISEPLEVWFNRQGKYKKTLTEQVISYKDNQKYANNYSFFNLFRTRGLPSIFGNNIEQEQRKLRHQLAVNEETIADLERAMPTVTDAEQSEFLTKKLEKCKLLQTTLKESLEAVNSGQKENEKTVKNTTQFIPYVDSYIDIPTNDKEELLEQNVPGARPPTTIGAHSESQGEFIAPNLQTDYCRVHYVELTSGTSPRAMFTQEKLTGSDNGFMLSAVEQSVTYDPASLLEYSLVMARTMLLGLDAPPTAKEQLIITGSDPVMIRYLWTALVILGERTPGMKFKPEVIELVTAAFSSEEEMVSSKKFSPTSLHETVFKAHEEFVSIKVKELENLLKLKSDPAAQAKLLSEELTEATVHSALR